MNIREIGTFEEFLALEEEWNRCVEGGPCDSIFLRHEWFDLYLRHVREHRSLRIMAAEEDGRIVGLFPGCFRRERIHRLKFKAAGFLSNIYSPICGIIQDNVERPVEEVFLGTLLDSGEFWDVLVLRDLPEENGCYERVVDALARLGLCFVDKGVSGNWYLPCEDLGYEGYLESRGQSRRKKLLYERRRLERTDGISCRVECSPGEALEVGIRDYYAVYARSWKAPEPYPAFHADLIRVAAKRGWLRLGIISLRNSPIAAQIWLVYKEKASIVKVAYDENFGRFSPGTVLSLVLLERVLDSDHVREVDFLSGDDLYKQEWMSARRERRSILAYNPRAVRGRILRLFDRHMYPRLKKFLKR